MRFRKFRQMMKTQAWCRKQTEVKGNVLERRKWGEEGYNHQG